jgi:hypothetical protein
MIQVSKEMYLYMGLKMGHTRHHKIARFEQGKLWWLTNEFRWFSLKRRHQNLPKKSFQMLHPCWFVYSPIIAVVREPAKKHIE